MLIYFAIFIIAIIIIIGVVIKYRKLDIEGQIKRVQEVQTNAEVIIRSVQGDVVLKTQINDKTLREVAKIKKHLDKATSDLINQTSKARVEQIATQKFQISSLISRSFTLSEMLSDILVTKLLSPNQAKLEQLGTLLANLIDSIDPVEICKLARIIAKSVYMDIEYEYASQKNLYDKLCKMNAKEIVDSTESLQKLTPNLYNIFIMLIDITKSRVCVADKFSREEFKKLLSAFVYTACNQNKVYLQKMQKLAIDFGKNVIYNLENNKLDNEIKFNDYKEASKEIVQSNEGDQSTVDFQGYPAMLILTISKRRGNPVFIYGASKVLGEITHQQIERDALPGYMTIPFDQEKVRKEPGAGTAEFIFTNRFTGVRETVIVHFINKNIASQIESWIENNAINPGSSIMTSITPIRT